MSNANEDVHPRFLGCAHEHHGYLSLALNKGMEDPIRVYRKECIVHKVTNKSALLLAVKVGGISGARRSLRGRDRR